MKLIVFFGSNECGGSIEKFTIEQNIKYIQQAIDQKYPHLIDCGSNGWN
jgi:hypothetical protein